MTGKERLEKLETKYSTLTVSSEKNSAEYTEVDVEDLVFLIQNGFKQIERVQELETTVDFYQSALRDADRRVQELEKRIKELEYASKYNGKLNEFLQKRKLPPNILGRHVVEVVMDYVEELEQQNQRYREALQQIKKATSHNKYWKEIAFKALEESK